MEAAILALKIWYTGTYPGMGTCLGHYKLYLTYITLAQHFEIVDSHSKLSEVRTTCSANFTLCTTHEGDYFCFHLYVAETVRMVRGMQLSKDWQIDTSGDW